MRKIHILFWSTVAFILGIVVATNYVPKIDLPEEFDLARPGDTLVVEQVRKDRTVVIGFKH